MPVMPQTAETLVKKKHERIMDSFEKNHDSLLDRFRELTRWSNELTLLNSPHIDRRPKK